MNLTFKKIALFVICLNVIMHLIIISILFLMMNFLNININSFIFYPIIMLFSLLIILCNSYLITFLITRQSNSIRQVLCEVRDGNYHKRVHFKRHEFLSELADDVDKTIELLNKNSKQLRIDFMTKLPNYHELISDLKKLNFTSNDQLFMLFFDVDKFKLINDNYGHKTGDELLTQIAARIKRMKLTHEKFYRYGGDEFVLVVVTDQHDDINHYIHKLDSLFKEPFQATGYNINVEISIGSINVEDVDFCVDEIVKKADESMYENKQNKC
ncbi:hypothetical protein BVH56_06665 [Abyssicoccus albus]|nr:hypothetical protein BVH56_06665 [Abyssicoccus albus]